jgi:hypothetical protein
MPVVAPFTNWLRCAPFINDIHHHPQVLDSYNQFAESDEATYSFNTELTKAVAAVKLSHDSELDVSEANHLKIAVSDVAALNTKQQ